MLGLTDEGIVLVFKRKSKNFFFLFALFWMVSSVFADVDVLTLLLPAK